MKRLFFVLLMVLVIFLPVLLVASSGGTAHPGSFPPTLESYHDSQMTHVGKILLHRMEVEPLNIIVTLLFLGAIIHTFLASKFKKISEKLREKHEEAVPKKENATQYTGDVVKEVSFTSEVFHFLGEIEVIFGLWVFPVLLAVSYVHGLDSIIAYINSVNFTEPVFVVVIMTLAATRPIIRLSEQSLQQVAKLGKGSPAALWFSVLTMGPILGSFVTEPGAMTISALILAKQFYARKPDPKFAYATIGLLFVNISVGGTLTHFAAPPVLMVAGKWNWDMGFMFTNFGYKAIIGILISNTLYFLYFRKDFEKLENIKISRKSKLLIPWDMREDKVPLFVTITHILIMIWTVYFAHYPPFFIGGFLIFLGFSQATGHHQNRINLKPALLVGFFLSGLVIHGGLQKWWIAPILGNLAELPLMLGATLLTAFNDNAAITYLSSLVPTFTDSMKYAVVAGAVTGGGLTVIANAPNPAGQSILQKFFTHGVAPSGLLLGALIPTIIMGLIFMLL
ncbi:putative Na+/H+ antiporter [bacterium]|nr:putative Na+/H+ antiporter [bacterium]